MTIAVRFATGLTHGELGFLAFRYVTFRTRKRCPNQPTMHGAVIVPTGVVIGTGIGVGVAGRRGIDGDRVTVLARRARRSIDVVR
jgi:hypothetical protein